MKNILELTGIRFFAAFAICAYHFSTSFGLDNISSTLKPAGVSAVSFFFILSGFILSYTYANRIQAIKLRQFFWARFSRLSPTFITVMITMIPIRLLFLMSAPDSVMASYGLSFDSPLLCFFTWLANLFLVAIFIPMLNPWLYFWNPPAWSLTAEAVFYVSFPVVITLFRQIHSKYFFVWSSLIIYLLLCLTIIGTFVLTTNIPVGILPEWYKSSLFLGGTQYTTDDIRIAIFVYFSYLLPFFHCFGFLIGCSIGYFFLKLAEEKVLPKKNTKNSLLLLSMILICIGYQVKNLVPIAMKDSVVYIPGFTLFIFALACGNTFASGLLSHKWVVELGKSSYALYISHFAVMAIHQYMANIGFLFPKFTYYIALGLSVALSLVIYYFVEVPGQRWLINFGKTSLNL